MQRILWGRSTSSNVMKVIWTLQELKLPYEQIDVGGPFGKTDTPDYLAMNPTGLVPTLQEDDFTLWESNAIIRYICNSHAPETTLWPRDQRARSACRVVREADYGELPAARARAVQHEQAVALMQGRLHRATVHEDDP